MENLNKNIMETTKYQANFRNTKTQRTVSQPGLSWGPPGHQWAGGISAYLQQASCSLVLVYCKYGLWEVWFMGSMVSSGLWDLKVRNMKKIS